MSKNRGWTRMNADVATRDREQDAASVALRCNRNSFNRDPEVAAGDNLPSSSPTAQQPPAASGCAADTRSNLAPPRPSAGRVRTVAFQASGEAGGDLDGGVAAPANAIRGARVGCLDVQVRRPNIGPGPDAAIVIRTGAVLLAGDQLTAQRRVRRPVLEFA